MRASSRSVRVAVVGGGIIGVCSALQLANDGFEVVLYDPSPGGGASFGNACQVAVSSCEPVSVPGLWRKLPFWLSDPLGPVSVRWPDFPGLLPWLLNWGRSGRSDRVEMQSDGMQRLFSPGLEGYRNMLGTEEFDRLFRCVGSLFLLRTAPTGQPTKADKLRVRHGIPCEHLSAAEVLQFEPSLTPDARGGIYFPRNGHTIDPRDLLLTLLGRFDAAGGVHRAEQVLKVVSLPGGRLRVIGVFGTEDFDKAVICAGIDSRDLLKGLGLKVQMTAMRGYHLQIPEPNIMPRCPIADRERGCAVTPIRDALRVSGTVEFAAPKAPMSEQRAYVLAEKARQILPGLKTDDASVWMGNRPCLPDGLPIIDAAPGNSNIVLAFGHGHYGMTGAPVTAQAVGAFIRNEQPQVEMSPYRARRFLSGAVVEAAHFAR